jgi:hypothetical protein
MPQPGFPEQSQVAGVMEQIRRLRHRHKVIWLSQCRVFAESCSEVRISSHICVLLKLIIEYLAIVGRNGADMSNM